MTFEDPTVGETAKLRTMVLINLKSSLPTGPTGSNDGFLYETTASTLNDDLIESLVEIHNARLRSTLIVDSVRELAMYGVMKKEVGTDAVSFYSPLYILFVSSIRHGWIKWVVIFLKN